MMQRLLFTLFIPPYDFNNTPILHLWYKSNNVAFFSNLLQLSLYQHFEFFSYLAHSLVFLI